MVVFGHDFVIGLTALDKGDNIQQTEVEMAKLRNLISGWITKKTQTAEKAAIQIREIARLGQRLVLMELR